MEAAIKLFKENKGELFELLDLNKFEEKRFLIGIEEEDEDVIEVIIDKLEEKGGVYFSCWKEDDLIYYLLDQGYDFNDILEAEVSIFYEEREFVMCMLDLYNNEKVAEYIDVERLIYDYGYTEFNGLIISIF